MVRVSIIVPAYNAEKTLGECLDSLLAQDYENYEIIVVDDGSTDNTKGVAESYGNNKIRCVCQPNGGVSAARNAGISFARGEYIIFCDADNCVSTRYVRTLMENADGDSLVICALTLTREALDTEDPDTTSATFDYLRSPEKLTALMEKCYVEGGFCKLFKRQILQQHDVQFDRSMSYAEDAKFVYQYLYIVRKVVYVNQFLYFYNTKNSTLTKPANTDEETINSLLTFSDFISESLDKGKFSGAFVFNMWRKRMVHNYIAMSLLSYAFLPYPQARMLQKKMRSHRFIYSCIKNRPWESINDHPRMRVKMKLLSRLDNGILWRLLGTLKRWQVFFKDRFR